MKNKKKAMKRELTSGISWLGNNYFSCCTILSRIRPILFLVSTCFINKVIDLQNTRVFSSNCTAALPKGGLMTLMECFNYWWVDAKFVEKDFSLFFPKVLAGSPEKRHYLTNTRFLSLSEQKFFITYSSLLPQKECLATDIILHLL